MYVYSVHATQRAIVLSHMNVLGRHSMSAEGHLSIGVLPIK